MNLPITTRRVFTDAEKSIYHRIRQELIFWGAQHRAQKGVSSSTALRICALHKVLNKLRGRVDCHVLKKVSRGYNDAQACVLAERLLQDRQLDVDQPLRCYVTVTLSGLKPGVVPRTSQLHVQAAHALAELMKHYGKHPDVTKWADVDQTLVVCQPERGQVVPRVDFGAYCPYGSQWPFVWFIDSHYGTPLAYALYPMTERCAVALGLTSAPLL